MVWNTGDFQPILLYSWWLLGTTQHVYGWVVCSGDDLQLCIRLVTNRETNPRIFQELSKLATFHSEKICEFYFIF